MATVPNQKFLTGFNQIMITRDGTVVRPQVRLYNSIDRPVTPYHIKLTECWARGCEVPTATSHWCILACISPAVCTLLPLLLHDRHLSSARTRLAPCRAQIFTAEDHGSSKAVGQRCGLKSPLPHVAHIMALTSGSGPRRCLQGTLLDMGSCRSSFVCFLIPFCFTLYSSPFPFGFRALPTSVATLSLSLTPCITNSDPGCQDCSANDACPSGTHSRQHVNSRAARLYISASLLHPRFLFTPIVYLYLTLVVWIKANH